MSDEYRGSIYLEAGDSVDNLKPNFLRVSFEKLLGTVLSPNEQGIFIENILNENEELISINTQQEAINFILAMEDIITADEIESFLRGISELEEEEEKNSSAPSKPRISVEMSRSRKVK